MPPQLRDRIEAWWEDNTDEGDCVLSDGLTPFSVRVPPARAQRVIVTPKPRRVIGMIEKGWLEADSCVVGQYALPTRNEWNFFRPLIEKKPLIFLGDLDVTDILIFHWMKSFPATKHMVYCGINDEFLDAVRFKCREEFLIRLQEPEQRCFEEFKKVFTRFREQLGNDSFALLSRGVKLELEAVTNYAKGPPKRPYLSE